MITYFEYLHVKDFALKNKKFFRMSAWGARRKAKDYFIKECKVPYKDLIKCVKEEREMKRRKQ